LNKIENNQLLPDKTVEYFFLERSDKGDDIINPDQGYLFGIVNIFSTGDFPNHTSPQFLTDLSSELKFAMKSYDIFKNKQLSLTDYHFGIVADDQLQVFAEFNDECMDLLLKTDGRLIIAGETFRFEEFLSHTLFLNWIKQT
jgi:hypothetical protein